MSQLAFNMGADIFLLSEWEVQKQTVAVLVIDGTRTAAVYVANAEKVHVLEHGKVNGFDRVRSREVPFFSC